MNKRTKEFLDCIGNGSGSEEQAYEDDTPEDEELMKVEREDDD